MKKSHLILIVLLLMVVGYAATQMKIDIKGNTTLSENTSDFNVYLANLKLNGTEIEGINETKDGYEINIPSKGTLEYDVINDSTEYDVEATVECEEETGANEVTNFDYTGGEQTFVAPVTGVYKLETWGAQGGDASSYKGGYGSFSTGEINAVKDDKLYINVGGNGMEAIPENTGSCAVIEGGYNGGGSAEAGYYKSDQRKAGSGGGATHIALKSGLLSTLQDYKNDILIVAGGGGGAFKHNSKYGNGGSAGGYIGNEGIFTQAGTETNDITIFATGGNQETGGSTGYGWNVTMVLNGSFGAGGYRNTCSSGSGTAGGGSGFYGGGAAFHGTGGGGSSYIGNSLLTEKSMYCYNCQESTDESTKTISTTCVNETVTENCAKSGNGYARITLIKGINSSTQLESTTIEAQDKVSKKIDIENNGMKCSLKIKKLSRTEKKDKYSGPTEWTFDYKGEEQTFTVPLTGTYKLETWGAQGGSINSSKRGGYGAYSEGIVKLSSKKNLYINVGSTGEVCNNCHYSNGGYNGGGKGYEGQNGNIAYKYNSGGGGATHIALTSGLLNALEDKKNYILIVSGGGAGSWYHSLFNTSYHVINAGDAGGISSNSVNSYNNDVQTTYTIKGATQTTGYKFGLGQCADTIKSEAQAGGGGGGLYGGITGLYGGTGGSSYIGNSLLTEKSMYCYNCTESTEESTKTISTTCVNSTPTENCAKKGNGYARITLISK